MSHARRLRELKQARMAEQANATPVVPPAKRAPITPELMRLSPARRHKALVAAGLALGAIAQTGTAVEREDFGPEATAYDLLRKQLGEHLRQLSDTESIELRIEMKRQLIPEYDDHIDTVLLTAMETDKAQQDEVFVRLMIWHLDCGLYTRGLEMAEHVLKYGLKLPENFKRNPASLITELVADNALSNISLKRTFDIEVLRDVERMVAGFDMHDIVAAKLHKAYGLLFLLISQGDENPDGPAGGKRAAQEEAQKHFLRALELDKNSGVKSHLRDLERALKVST